MLYDIATAGSRTAKKWKNEKISWADFTEKLEKPIRTGETVAEYQGMSKEERDKRKDQGGFVSGFLEGGKRTRQTVKHRQIICLDADNVSRETDFPAKAAEVFADYAYIIYSTHSHTKDAPRYRLIVPLTAPISAEAYEPAARYLANKIGLNNFDPTTYDPSRLMYWPSAPTDGEYVFVNHAGMAADTNFILSQYVNWRDVNEWPIGDNERRAREQRAQKLGDPREKPGAVGLFCQAYTISAAITKFLPEIYTPCAVPNRFSYASANSTAGLVVYDDDLLCYSHHATDPVCGLDVNAFDLVRIHKFGALDTRTKEDTPINKHPSFAAMCDFALKDKEVIKLQNKSIADKLKDEDLDLQDFDWLGNLERNKQGKPTVNAANFLLIMENDPHLKDTAGLDLFSHRIMVKRDLPWREKADNDLWRDSDDAQLRNYISTTYDGLTGRTLIDDAFIETVNKHSFHQVKDFWQSLIWDNKPRIATLLIDYLGAADNEYTKAATVLFFKAAVARIFSPGIKFDSCLVLTGAQGIGKSTILSRMGGKWFNDSIVTLTDKDVLEQLQGSLIVELAEMQATKRAENEQIKAFITRQVDKFRVPYGRRTEEYPRQCVFAATTNEDIFLKDRTGNRRFLIVPCQGNGRKPLDDFTYSEASQCWAELVQIYAKDKSLTLPKRLLPEAQKLQENHTEGSEKIGLVEAYLDKLLPPDWDEMDLAARRSFLRGDDTERTGTTERKRVCVLEIWCECYENPRANLRTLDAREINGIMRNIKGWESAGKTTMRFSEYGVQRAYIRLPNADDLL